MITCGVRVPEPCQGEPAEIVLVGLRQYRSTMIAWTAYLRCARHDAASYVREVRMAFPERIFVVMPILYGKLKIITPAERTSNEARNPHYPHVPCADR